MNGQNCTHDYLRIVLGCLVWVLLETLTAQTPIFSSFTPTGRWRQSGEIVFLISFHPGLNDTKTRSTCNANMTRWHVSYAKLPGHWKWIACTCRFVTISIIIYCLWREIEPREHDLHFIWAVCQSFFMLSWPRVCCFMFMTVDLSLSVCLLTCFSSYRCR